MADADAKRLWEGVCILEELRLIERDDGKSELVLVWKEGMEKRLARFLRRETVGPPARPGGESGRP